MAGWDPIATATGTRPRESRRWAAPSLWICQCIIAVRRSTFWMRYMPQLRACVTGSRLKTSGRVTNGPPSSGQQVRMGKRSRSGSSSQTSWQGPSFTIFDENDASSRSLPNAFILATTPWGGCRSISDSIRSPSASRLSVPSARHIRRSVPNWLMRTGSRLPTTLVKSRAGPPALETRSAISVISSAGLTGASMRTSSPCFSSSAIHSRRSFIGRAPPRVRGWGAGGRPAAPGPRSRRRRTGRAGRR